MTDRIPTIAEQKAQGAKCGCLGTDDYCPCQNVVRVPRTPLEELADAEAALVAAKRRVAAAHCGEVGHTWKHIGGRNANCTECAAFCSCSIPVHECTKCGDCDYGENAEAWSTMIYCQVRRGGG